MIRIGVLCAVVTFLAAYAWKDWYKGLCGLVVLLAVIEHPDMPRTLFGVQGLNPWNILLAVVLLSWLAQRRREGLAWDMPPAVTVLLLLYLAVVVIGFCRMFADRSALHEFSTGYLVSEYLINTVKWVIPGLLLYDGCRSRERFTIAVAAVLAVYLLLGIQVIKWMPFDAAFRGDTLTSRSGKIIVNEIGFHRVNLATLLAGGAWAMLAATAARTKTYHAVLIVTAFFATTYALGLTAGRGGYVAWAVTGIALCLLRWRRYLLVIPIVVPVVGLVVPGVIERLSQGFGGSTTDVYTVTAGRDVAWPVVIDKIAEEPLIGFGRRAMERTGLTTRLRNEFDEDFGHPHNAYLELILDNGWVGACLILPFYVYVLYHAITLFRDMRSRVYAAAGGITLAVVLAFLVGGVGSQTFYPREGALPMWCAIGLLFRVSTERARVDSRSHHTALRDSSLTPDPSSPVPPWSPFGDAWWRPRSRAEAAGTKAWVVTA